MDTEIHRLSLGICNCYLVKQEGLILIDGGAPKQLENFRRKMAALSIKPQDISLLLLTHGHWDHIGSASDLKGLTDCQVAVNHREKHWVERALKPIPPGVGPWGVVLAFMARVMASRATFPGAKVDLALGDEQLSLEPFGINGKVLHTPGHSSGSMSLLLNAGEAFVGDLAMNGLPMRIGPGMPFLAEDTDAIKASWRLLLDNGATMIYPAHGKPFSADVLKKAL